MPTGIPYQEALTRYRATAGSAPQRDDAPADAELLRQHHPDHGPNARVELRVGASRGAPCHPEVAATLQSNALIDDVDLAGAAVTATDVLIVGGGGAGAAAALAAAEHGAKVLLTNKLRLGDSNTVMAEGGIQAAIGADDSLQRHFEDTLRGGHFRGEPELVAQMVRDGPAIIRWLIQLGMMFDLEDDRPMGGRLLRKKPGGATAARILSYHDYTGLEMMRVLREAVSLDPRIAVWNRCPLVELLTDEHGSCVGAVHFDLEAHRFMLVRAQATILATGGIGSLHLNGFPTSNHFGSTGDGLVLAYRAGARLREMDAFQFHPTGIAYPPHLSGVLVSEAARSSGAKLVNGCGERFVDELKTRDVVAAAILRECAEGRGVVRSGQVGVFLDTPTLERENPGILEKRLVTLRSLGAKCGQDAAEEPFIVRPTLHYQNGGVVIDKDGATGITGLYCAGELAGGLHGRNRLMGNALLDILSMGRRAGAKAAEAAGGPLLGRAGIGHVYAWQRQLLAAGLPLDVKGPLLFPSYANFDLRADAGQRHRVAAAAE